MEIYQITFNIDENQLICLLYRSYTVKLTCTDKYSLTLFAQMYRNDKTIYSMAQRCNTNILQHQQ